MRILLLVAAVIIIGLVMLLLLQAVRISKLKGQVIDLENRIEGLNEPELWLDKEERKELARKRIARAEQLQAEADIRRFTNPLENEVPKE